MRHEHLRGEDILWTEGEGHRLDHMDFWADSGEAVGLIGLTGAGKTAMAEVLCGEKAPASGQIWLDTKRAAAEQLARNGVLIQRGSTLLRNLSITDNLLSLGCPTGMSPILIQKKKQRNQCRELLEQFGMEEYLDASVPQLPASVQHRLFMIGAVARGKKFLALDHLSDGCTPQEQKLLVDCIQQLCRQGITILYITGHIDSVLQQMDRIIVMRDGRRVKEFYRGEYAKPALYTYVYGDHMDLEAGGIEYRPAGKPSFTLDGYDFCTNELVAIHDVDGSAEALVSRMEALSPGRISVLSADALSGCWIPTMSVLDNILLTVSRRIGGPACHVRGSIRRVISEECAAESGLTEEQMTAPFARLNRIERFRLLLYRERLLGPDICIFNRITAGADFRDRLSITQIVSRLPGLVLYLSSDYAELETFETRILSLTEGRLQRKKL